VFTNTSADAAEQVVQAEIYIMNPDGSKPIRLTNDGFADALPALFYGAKLRRVGHEVHIEPVVWHVSDR
jgi:hypothetical protein